MSALQIAALSACGWFLLALAVVALLARAGHHRNKHRRHRR